MYGLYRQWEALGGLKVNSFSSIMQLHDKMVVMDGIGDRQKSMIAERMGVRMIYLTGKLGLLLC